MAVGAFAEVTTDFLNSAEVHDPETPAPSRSVSAARPASHHWQQHISTLSFVDLAGSERVKKSGSSGNQLKEAQCINKSLSALVDVISALSSDGQHIPYRNHKLTMVMSDSPGGNAKTLMFVNLSPAESNLDETYNSLMYASRARCIVNDPSKNKEVARLKKLVSCRKEQAGKRAEEEELEEIQEERPTKEKSDGRLSM